MKITRIKITDYRGIAALDVKLPDAGAVVKGANAKGKTSVLRAIADALTAQGLGADAVRMGADEAEVIVDLDKVVRVRRRITAAGGVTLDVQEGNNRWTKPQTRLNELLGTAPLDALQFFLAKPAQRRQLLIEAMPAAVTAEDVERWIGLEGSCRLEGIDVDLNRPGLQVVDQLRKVFYGQRTNVNRDAKEAAAEVAKRHAAAAGLTPASRADLDIDADLAYQDLQAAQLALAEWDRQRGIADGVKAQGDSTRKHAETLRARAREALAAAPPVDPQVGRDAQEHLRVRANAVARLRRELNEAVREHVAAEQALDVLQDQANAYLRAQNDADQLEADALELDKQANPAPGPTDEQLQSARARVQEQRDRYDRGKRAAEFKAMVAKVEDAAQAKKALTDEAALLDKIVVELQVTAPAELAARAGGIPGLTLDDDVIKLDGVAIDSLSGAEQMRFAIEVCRRLNAKAKILVVDGMERLDKKQMAAFVDLATSDGWQLIGTRVTEGELVVEAIES